MSIESNSVRQDSMTFEKSSTIDLGNVADPSTGISKDVYIPYDDIGLHKVHRQEIIDIVNPDVDTYSTDTALNIGTDTALNIGTDTGVDTDRDVECIERNRRIEHTKPLEDNIDSVEKALKTLREHNYAITGDLDDMVTGDRFLRDFDKSNPGYVKKSPLYPYEILQYLVSDKIKSSDDTNICYYYGEANTPVYDDKSFLNEVYKSQYIIRGIKCNRPIIRIEPVKVTQKKMDDACRVINGTVIGPYGICRMKDNGKFIHIPRTQMMCDFIACHYVHSNEFCDIDSYKGKSQVENIWDGSKYVTNGEFLMACSLLNIVCEHSIRYGTGINEEFNSSCNLYIDYKYM